MIKRKFLYKMLTLYFSIILLYTSITSGIILYKGFEMSNMQTNHSHELYMDQASNYADSKFNIALDFVYKISTLTSFIDYRYSPTPNYLYITNLYNDLISYLQGFNQLGFTLGITKFTDNMVITPNGTYSYNYYLEELGINSSSLNIIKDSIHQPRSLHTYVVPKSMMKYSPNKIILIHQPVGTSKLSPIYFFIVLDTNSLLPEVRNEASGNFSIYTDELISPITHNLDIEGKDISEYISSLKTQKNINHLTIDSTVNYIHPSTVIPNLKYTYTTKAASLLPILIDILKTSLIPSLILFISGIWLAYKAAQSSYQPVRQLLKFVDSQKNIHLSMDYDNIDYSGINELDYIQLNIKQIYSMNDYLQNKLNNSFLRLQEDFFRKVIYNIANENFIKENLSMLKLENFKENLNLILLDCEGVENLHKLFPTQNLSLLIYELISQFEDNISHFFVLPLDKKKYCIISSNQSKEKLCELCKYLIDKIVSNLSLDITACVSSNYSLNQLSLGLQELLMLNNYKYSNANNKILTSEYIQEIKDVIYYYPIEIETCLINYICTNEFNKSKNLLLDLLNKNLGDLQLNPVNITNLKYSLITTFKRCLNNDGKTLNQFMKEYPEVIDKFIDSPIYALKEECITIFEKIFNYCNKDKFNLENSTASNIFMYIHENFDKDISLTDIAKHFGLSESYISKLLKSSLDINFKAYVNKLKVNRAKELLSQGNYKVNEVATIIGCNNANTFIRIFKQYEGVSPGEYIKSLNKLNI